MSVSGHLTATRNTQRWPLELATSQNTLWWPLKEARGCVLVTREVVKHLPIDTIEYTQLYFEPKPSLSFEN